MKKVFVQKYAPRSGVYAIINLIEKKAYIGETIDYYQRITQHLMGIYNLRNATTNKNLMDEKNKSFVIIKALSSEYDKSTNSGNIRNWIADETIVMYLFRANGFTLYNGDELGKDNVGYNRSFLMDKEIDDETLKNKTIEFLKENDFDYSEKIFRDTESKVNEAIKSTFGDSTDIALLGSENSDKLTENINQDNFYITKRTCTDVCDLLLNAKLSTDDLRNCGLEEMSVEKFAELVDNGEFNKVLFSKFGNYLSQSPITILSTKCYDIQHTKLSDLRLSSVADGNDVGICFWAARKINMEMFRNFMSEFSTQKDPRYVIMPCTSSMEYGKFYKNYSKILNPNTDIGEDLESFHKRLRNDLSEDIYACSFTENAKSKGTKTIPETMFPPIIDKYGNENKALLISKFYYLDADYEDFKLIYNYFYSVNANFKKEELAYTYGVKGSKSINIGYDKRGGKTKEEYKQSEGHSSMSHMSATLKPQAKDGLINFIKNKNTQDPYNKATSFIIAKIEYPYIVRFPKEK